MDTHYRSKKGIVNNSDVLLLLQRDIDRRFMEVCDQSTQCNIQSATAPAKDPIKAKQREIKIIDLTDPNSSPERANKAVTKHCK